MLQNIGTKVVNNLAKETAKKGIINLKYVPTYNPPNNVIYAHTKYFPNYKPEFKQVYNKFYDNFTKDIKLKNENLKFAENIPRTINLGLFKNVEIINRNEKQNYLAEKYGFKEHPEEIKNKVSKEEYERIRDLYHKKSTLENFYINKLHLLVNNVKKDFDGLESKYHLNLTEEQILKEYRFASNSTNFRLQIIKQKLQEFNLVSKNEIKDFENKINLTETQIDKYTKLLETYDNKQLVNEIIMDELKQLFNKTVTNIKSHYKVSKELLSRLNKNFNEAYKEKVLNSKFILFLFNVAKQIKNSKLLKDYLTSLNTYFNNVIITAKNMQNKLASDFNKIIEYFKTVNKKGVETKYITEFYELLVSPNVNKEQIITKINELMVLINKNNYKEFNNKINKFLNYIKKSYKMTKKTFSILKSKNKLDQLLIKDIQNNFNLQLDIDIINKIKHLMYKQPNNIFKKNLKENDNIMSLNAINIMSKLY